MPGKPAVRQPLSVALLLASLKPGGAHNDISLNALGARRVSEANQILTYRRKLGFSALCGFKLPAPITPLLQQYPASGTV
jgi:hypothetical protein